MLGQGGLGVLEEDGAAVRKAGCGGQPPAAAAPPGAPVPLPLPLPAQAARGGDESSPSRCFWLVFISLTVSSFIMG